MGKSEANTFPCRAERSYRLRIGADFVTSPAREDFRSSFSKGSVGASVGESRWSSVFCRGSCQLPDGEADHCRGSRACRAVAAAEAGSAAESLAGDRPATTVLRIPALEADMRLA